MENNIAHTLVNSFIKHVEKLKAAFEAFIISETEYLESVGEEAKNVKLAIEVLSFYHLIAKKDAQGALNILSGFIFHRDAEIEEKRSRCRDCAYLYEGENGEWICDHYIENVLNISHCREVED